MKLFPILKNTFACWLDDDAPTLGAALAEYTVFLLAPLLIISIAISGYVLSEEAASGQIFAQLRMNLDDLSGYAMQDVVQSAGAKPEGSVIAAEARSPFFTIPPISPASAEVRPPSRRAR